jgi:hypothetical protein
MQAEFPRRASSPLLLCLVLAFCALSSPAFSQTGNYTKLQVGSNNTFDSGFAMALGNNNSISDYYDYSLTSTNILAIGSSNWVYSDPDDCRNLLLLGTSNGAEGAANSLFVGTLNFAWSYTAQCLVAGNANNLEQVSNSLVVGTNNDAGYTMDGAMIGYGLSNWSSGTNGVIIGRYNQDVGALFTVGNGASSQNRSNAFVVLQNGDVIIPKRQGSILMGQFGNAGD